MKLYIAHIGSFAPGSQVLPNLNLRKSSLPLAILAMGLSANAEAANPVVMSPCNTCVTYSDIAAYALTVASHLGSDSQPGYTKILVTSAKVPKSFVFDYKVWYGGTFPYYSCTVTPVSSYPATDDGAVSLDYQLYGARRVSGLPTVKAPPLDPRTGDQLNSSTPTDELQQFISSTLLPIVGTPHLSTLPGLTNWKFYPSITVVYNGKQYTLYDGETITIEFADGSTATGTVQVSTALATVGYLVIKKTTPPKSVSVTPVTPSPNQTSMVIPSLDTSSMTYVGIPLYIYGTGTTPLPIPSVTVIQYPSPTEPSNQPITTYDDFEFDIG